MALDLTVCVDKNTRHDWANTSGYDRLEFDRNYDLFNTIKGLCPEPMPEGMTLEFYHAYGLRLDEKDSRGDRITRLRAAAFDKLPDHLIMNSWNRAIITFLQSLPGNLWVYLWWH